MDHGELIWAAVQVILLCLRCSMAACSVYLRRMAENQQALRSQVRVIRRRNRDRHVRALRRQARQRWFVLAGVRSQHRYWVYPQTTDWTDNFVFSLWGDEQWLFNFRMTKDTFMEIVNAIRGKLERRRTRFRDPVSVERRVAIAIWYLANANTYREVMNQFGVGLATVGEIVLEVCFAIEVELYRKIVCIGNDVARIMEGFSGMGFPHCIGAVDGTHIAIKSPGGRVLEYGNRKNYSSMVLQAVVDDKGKFLNTEIGWSGRSHDAYIFANSWFCRAMDAGALVPGNPTLVLEGVSVPAVVLGDAAYPMRKWLMTQYRFPRDARERHFNYALSRARNVVECAFGRLKARWRCLSARLTVSNENVVSLITACVVLHNICEARGHALTAADHEESRLLLRRSSPQPLVIVANQDYNPNDPRNLDEGKEVREVLANFIFGNRQR